MDCIPQNDYCPGLGDRPCNHHQPLQTFEQNSSSKGHAALLAPDQGHLLLQLVVPENFIGHFWYLGTEKIGRHTWGLKKLICEPLFIKDYSQLKTSMADALRVTAAKNGAPHRVSPGGPLGPRHGPKRCHHLLFTEQLPR